MGSKMSSFDCLWKSSLNMLLNFSLKGIPINSWDQIFLKNLSLPRNPIFNSHFLHTDKKVLYALIFLFLLRKANAVEFLTFLFIGCTSFLTSLVGRSIDQSINQINKWQIEERDQIMTDRQGKGKRGKKERQ